MRLQAGFAALAIAILSACDSPPMQNSPPEENLVNATLTDQAYPSEATANDIITGDEVVADSAGNATGPGNAAGGGNAVAGGGRSGQEMNGQ